MSTQSTYRRVTFAGGFVFACLLALGSTSAFAAGQPGDVDLSPTPPDLTASVDPNIVVTFDDSGSMASNFMGDFRPFDTGSWSGPWFCAGSIDQRISDPANIRSHSMNGTFYNPLPPGTPTGSITYTPPLREDNTPFPNPDATLNAVWADGIAINRPTNAQSPAGATYLNNPNGPSTTLANDNRVGNLMGLRSTVAGRATGRNAACPANADPGSCSCTGTGSSRVCTWTVTTDNRWTCGNGTSPMDGVTANPDGGTYPDHGPYYYRLKSNVSITLDAFGNPDAASITRIYTASNWEAIPVPASEYQNFANWYAYYRTRNLMTRSALSRVFGQFGDNIRATWQNINNSTFLLPSTTIITNLNDTNTAAPNYRKSFYDWLFSVGANGTTPDRKAVIRAGEFFRRGNTANLLDPYWQPGQGTQPGQELACRQNFNMLVTDGYWNEGNPTPPSGFFGVQNPPSALPDGTSFSRSDPTSRVFWDVPVSPSGTCANDGSTDCYPSMADIAFYYWAKDLRTDLNNNVPPYVPDTTTGITGSTNLQTGQDPLQIPEIYNNPANDPATWQHVVQFMVTLGIAGKLQFSDDVDCTDPNNDLCDLRKGVQNSAGITGWPQPARNAPPAIDDTWHAAVNSRGSYFSASNPNALVQHLTDIIDNILGRKGSSTALSATMSTLTTGTQGYSAGYNFSDYSGYLIKQDLDPDTGETGATIWDASCTLTGGTYSGGVCTLPPPPLPDASVGRTIYTVNDAGTSAVTFTSFSSLSTGQQTALNQDPTATVKCTSPTANTNGCDGNGSIRADWLRGVRIHESTPPLLRHRSSVLGAIINSQPRYVSAPTGGFTDNFPPGSPEALAAAPNANGTPGAGSYAQFVQNNRNRAPTVYVGANDGMLHAFDGVTGHERWAFMPMTLFGTDAVSGEPDTTVIAKRRLAQATNTSMYKNAPSVDNTAVIQDVFINGEWRTVLVGTLRYGGRGIYALDITDPTQPTFLWEHNYTQSGFQHLGYTYAYPNVSRISYNGGTWVVLLSNGYFPLPDQTPPDPVGSDVSANLTSLFVINVQTGALIREIPTTLTAPSSFGLSTAAAYDLNSDQVDDISVAGDLAGNLWRFDLSNQSSGSWSVDLMFKSYTTSGDIGKHPISVMPVGMRDPVNQTPMWVFGTGKFLGLCDRTASSPPSNCGPDANTAIQAFYGVRDYGTASTNYPILPTQLNSWTIAEDTTTFVRTLTGPTTVASNRGWTIPLDPALTHELGERDVVSIVPFYSANYAILTTLIPKGDDPCDPDRRGAIMAVDGATGGPLVASPLGGGGPGSFSNNTTIGMTVDSRAIPIAGIPAVVGSQGGPLLLPGLPQFAIPAPPPHRGSWRELLDLL